MLVRGQNIRHFNTGAAHSVICTKSLVVHVNRNGLGEVTRNNNDSDPSRFRVRFGSLVRASVRHTGVRFARSFRFFRPSMTNRVRASPATIAHHVYRVLVACARPNGCCCRHAFVPHGYTPCEWGRVARCG